MIRDPFTEKPFVKFYTTKKKWGNGTLFIISFQISVKFSKIYVIPIRTLGSRPAEIFTGTGGGEILLGVLASRRLSASPHVCASYKSVHGAGGGGCLRVGKGGGTFRGDGGTEGLTTAHEESSPETSSTFSTSVRRVVATRRPGRG